MASSACRRPFSSIPKGASSRSTSGPSTAAPSPRWWRRREEVAGDGRRLRAVRAAGYDREQILADFERSYGEFVRLEPPMRGVNWLVWFGPAGVLVAGGAVVAWALRRSPRSGGEKAASPLPRDSDLPSRDTLPADPRLAAAVRRVRTLAYGWPDGIAPKEQS